MSGPLKGQIQEFVKPEITFGRHPSCDVVFPADLQSISRHHAKLVRDGNRFKMIDSSTNGTSVNGQKVSERYLKNGDIITFSADGPKVSFIAQASTLQPEPEEHRQPEPVPQKSPQTIPAAPPQPALRPGTKPPQPANPPKLPENLPPVKANLLIQYGPTLQSYDRLPIEIGSNRSCDFILTTAGICDRHAIIIYNDQQYKIAELSGQNLITINAIPLTQETPLNPNDIIMLTKDGPAFKFLEGGRLMQQEIAQTSEPTKTEPQHKNEPQTEGMQSKAKSLLGKYFNRN
jgi:pSer/pThr/pTyr-binding forkhead associated (FHA) protein